MEKLLKGCWGNAKKRGDYVGKGGCCYAKYFSSWGVANVTTVTSLTMREVASSANSYANCHYGIYLLGHI